MKTKKDLKVLGIVAVILLTIGTFTDLQISQAVYNQESAFGKIFEAFGEFPAMFIAGFCSMAVGVIRKQRNNGKLDLKGVLGFVFAVLFGLTAGVLPINYLDAPKALGLVLGVVIVVADYKMVKAIANSHEEELYNAAVFGLQLFVFVMLAFNLIKFGWGRERYRHMMEVGSVAGFSAWYLPQGLASGNEFMSFPSGHSANAAISMWITMLPVFVPALKTKETMLKVISCIWIACVMVSRIIMGAHFLSDVTMGMTISLLLFYVLYRRKYK